MGLRMNLEPPSSKNDGMTLVLKAVAEEWTAAS